MKFYEYGEVDGFRLYYRIKRSVAFMDEDGIYCDSFYFYSLYLYELLRAGF